MAKQTNKTVIGAFVVFSIAILVGGMIILGGGDMFKKKNKYVLFFENSIKGLSVGAPVILGGVEVGAVSNISLNVHKDQMGFDVPVIIEIDPTLMVWEGKRIYWQEDIAKQLIKKGLRAQLTLQSVVTSQMMIELEFLPDTPVRLTGLNKTYPEIPTVPSSMEQLTQKLEKLPIEKITQTLLDVIENIDDTLSSAEIHDILKNVGTATEKFNVFMTAATRLVNDTDKRLTGVSKDLQMTLSDTRTLINNTNGQIQPLSTKIQASLVSLKKSTDQVKKTLKHVDGFIGEDSDSRHKLNRSLDEIGAAARSLKSLADYLERHPEALIKGKGGQS
jgi:paraquat-inducible protein B